ncbi:hypothetical protein AB0D54_12720 [Streptomyces xanthophaeus]|uniref:hypothetical protein n=1 Tax=Streptomyces xanthophaeus TaxID=67385 RepID=UPI003449A81D
MQRADACYLPLLGEQGPGERHHWGYRLAGGYAVQTHRLVSRVSDDVDLFTPIGRAEGELPQAVARLAEAYRTAGYLVQVTQQAQVYARLHVTEPASGAQSKVELVGDLLHHPPVESDLGPALHLDDLAAAKTGLFSAAPKSGTPSTSTRC